MAEVPYSGVPSVAPDSRPPDDYQRIDAKPEQFGAAIGKGLQQAGQGVANAGENVFDISKFQGKVNTDDQGNHTVSRYNTVMYGDPTKPAVGADGQPLLGPDGKPQPDTGYMGLQGRSASDQRQGTLEQLDKIREEGRANLKSPQEQLEYDMQTRRLHNEAVTKIGAHADAQWKTWAAGVNDRGAGLSLNGFVNSLDNAESMTHHASDYINFKVQESQIKFGDDPTIRSEAIAGAKRDLLKAQTDRIAVTDPASALRILDKNKNIAGTQYDDMYGRLRARAEHQTGQSKANQYVQEATNGGLGTVAALRPETQAFFRARSNARVDGMNPVFADRLMQAATDFEQSNPGRRAFFESLRRTREEQAAAYHRYQTGQGGLAAPPGYSRHEYGFAADIPNGAFQNWLHANGDRYGLEFLRGRSFENDPGHVQIAGQMPQGATAGGPAAGGAPLPASSSGGLPLPATRPAAWPTTLPEPRTQSGAQPAGGFEPAAVTLAPASPHMPEQLSPAPTMGEQLAFALRKAIEDPELNDNERTIAIQGVERQFKVLEITENQNAKAKKELSDNAANEHLTALYDMAHTPNPDYVALAGRINHDPRLTWETKRSLLEMTTHRSGEEQSLGFGPGYSDAYDRILLPPDNPNRINDVNDILKMGGSDGRLTPAGADRLVKTLNTSRRDPDQAAVAQTKSSLMQYERSKLTFDQEPMWPGGPVKRDEKGIQAYHAQFVPKVEAAYDAWIKAGKNPWEFLTKDNFDKLAAGIRSKAEMEAERLVAGGEGNAQKDGAPAVKLPPTPDGLRPEGWVPLMNQLPVTASGKPWKAEDWAGVLQKLEREPTPELKEIFRERFRLDPDKVIDSLHGKPDEPVGAPAGAPPAAGAAAPPPAPATYAERLTALRHDRDPTVQATNRAEHDAEVERKRRADEAATVDLARHLRERRAEWTGAFAKGPQGEALAGQKQREHEARAQELENLDRQEFFVEKSGLGGAFKAAQLRAINERREKLRQEVQQ